ncbi:ImmA/IrrE family metallo-endopeptidase [Sphingobium sp. CCH11-B1]|uniref:ImmA/IrrE family metallo-endopeptidase n=1 Tax=Sphingobium sp. CCH11-B1 TaxID=1768781 RepID=UPI000831775B|nr:ImmA/IrrE family metallo-endopeptidase [Sphingobium sp. CCH11-B1]
MKADDSSLDPHQYRTVQEAALKLLNKGEAWGRYPTPVADVMDAAQLKVASISIFDHGALEHYIKLVGDKVGQFVRKATEKVRGIFDVEADIVHIDPTLSQEKQTFLTFHEAGHKEIPHQRGIYKFIQDCTMHLRPETADLFEREANTFASIVLFQNDTFATETADYEFGIKVPMKHGKRFGASVYASIREYVRRNTRACAVIVFDPAEACNLHGIKVPLRRMEFSADYVTRFGGLHMPDQIVSGHALMPCIPMGQNQRMSKPHSFELVDRNGDRHEFVGEGFKTPYNTFVLIHCAGTLGNSLLITSAA